MLSKRTQVVISIGVLLVAVAFLLVGLEFSQLQGLVFQNGANSLQLFANNLGAVQDALYMAPSSMSISLSGNNSLCKWDQATDSYNCAGGSKIYNISYASGPTLDAGNNMFSAALCFMLGNGPSLGSSEVGVAGSGASSELALTGEDAVNSLSKDALEASNAQGILKSIEEDPALSDAFQSGKIVIARGAEGATITTAKKATEQGLLVMASKDGMSEEMQSALEESAAKSVPGEIAGAASESGMASSLGSRVPALLFKFLKNRAKSLLFNFGVPLVAVYFGENYNTISQALSKSPSPSSRYPPYDARLVSNVVLSSYDPNSIPLQYAAASVELQRYGQTRDLINALLSNLPPGPQGYTIMQTAEGALNLQQNSVDELAQNALSSPSASPSFSTPTQGVAAPSSLSSPNSFIGNVPISGSGDPLLALASFAAQDSLLVYGRTASCMGTLAQGFSPHESVAQYASQGASIVGAYLTFLNVYSKANIVWPLGTYFLGYSGEVYLNGMSSGRPTQVGAPVITDMSDVCRIAQTSSMPGSALRTMVVPSGNGTLSFSVSQGMFNTMCSQNSALYPKTFSSFIDRIINAQNNTDVSILLPPQYAISFSNSSGSTNICLNRLFIGSNDFPLVSTSASLFQSLFSNSLVTEYGVPVACVNITNVTNGKYSVGFSFHRNGLSPTVSGAISSKASYMNNQSEVAFSVPVSGSVGHFETGAPPKVTVTQGVDSPRVEVLTGIVSTAIKKYIPPLKASVSNSILTDLISAAYKITGLFPNSSFYGTDYTNVTFKVNKTSPTGINLFFKSNNVMFGVYPNNPSSQFGGNNLINISVGYIFGGNSYGIN